MIMKEKKSKDYGYRPSKHEERGYQPTNDGYIPNKPQGGYKPEKGNRDNPTPNPPPKKP